MTLRKLSLLLFLLLLGTSAVKADTATVKLTGVNGASNNGYYIDPYYGTVNGKNTTLWCVDFKHDVWIGDQWTANVTAISDTADYSKTNLFTTYGAQTEQVYKEIAWLITNYSQDPVSAQWVIWDLSMNSIGANAAGHPNYNSLFQAAASNWASVNTNGWSILTNVNLSQPDHWQEFVTTPEPGTIMLLGTGLISLGTFMRRRKRV
ncbi:MAG TPA: PEP-CTERM sorting domain-containing protein [Terriglobia bacterium]|jgi:hypothetical protein|nr:PEP-CTERM sorting domain-containing protein [Terriglobia bacterium]